MARTCGAECTAAPGPVGCCRYHRDPFVLCCSAGQDVQLLNFQNSIKQCLMADPQLSIQHFRPNSWPDIAAWCRINLPHQPVSVHLLAGLSPKHASAFALVKDAEAQNTATSVRVYSGQALSPIHDEVQNLACCWTFVQDSYSHTKQCF